MTDPKFAFHQLLRKPGFIAVAVMTLALGILTNTVRGAETIRASEWTTALPEDVGFDSSALGEMFDHIREHKPSVHSVQIVRRGKLVLDAVEFQNSAEPKPTRTSDFSLRLFTLETDVCF